MEGRDADIRGDQVSSNELQDVGVCQGCVVESGGINQDDLLPAHVKGR